MQWWQWLVGILLFIVALGVLIGIHELGHLSAAKLFNVYCLNYSIGFGPKLISSKRSAKHETIWSLRAIPLGGFVAMYGEGVDLDTTDYVPPSRSLEGVARYKRAIIIAAGVFLNFILGFVLILSHNAFFPRISFTSFKADRYISSLVVSSNNHDVADGDAIVLKMDPIAKVKVSNFASTNVFLIDTDVHIPGVDAPYVMVMKNSIATTKVDPDLSLSFSLYKRMPVEDVIKNSVSSGYTDSFLKSIIITNEEIDPKDETKIKELDERIKKYTKEEKDIEYTKQLTYFYKEGLKTDYSIDVASPYYINDLAANEIKSNISFFPKDEVKKFDPSRQYTVTKSFILNEAKNGWNDTGIALKRDIYWRNGGEVFADTWNEWCASNSAIFNALGRIFTGNTQDIGGIITIAVQSSQVLTDFGIERYLFLWGTISCNLAIINLLPFPGLDGWSLVVIAYEAITKKQIPTKVKSIISFVGLILLFGLMVLIIIQDILRFV